MQQARRGMTTTSCHVWLADVGQQRPVHHTLLDPVEAARRAAFWQEADRSRFTTAAALLRLVVAAETGVRPELVRVDRSCSQCGAPHGKPQLPDTDLQVSVSHAHRLVAVAITRVVPVGVDVEAITARGTAGLARLTLAPGEPVRRAEDFFTYWCRKESVVKATGDGLRVPLRQVVVSPADEPARLLSYRGGTLTATVRDLEVRGGYAGALTVLTDQAGDVRTHDAAALLIE